MHDNDLPWASEQVFVTGSDNPYYAVPGTAPPPSPPQDWHRADIIAAVKKTGTSMCALSRQHQLASNTLANALTRKWPRAERIIADRLNVPPWVIWPSRYPDRTTPEPSAATPRLTPPAP